MEQVRFGYSELPVNCLEMRNVLLGEAPHRAGFRLLIDRQKLYSGNVNSVLTSPSGIGSRSTNTSMSVVV
jgi:hypothetical protein